MSCGASAERDKRRAAGAKSEVARPRKGTSAGARPTKSRGASVRFERHLREQRGARGVADGDRGPQLERTEQLVERGGDGGQRGLEARGRAGEGVSGEVGRDHGEALGEPGQQAAKGVGRSARAVEQEQRGTAPHHLHVPAEPSALDEPAVRAVRPVAALDAPVGAAPAHVRAPSASDCTWREIAAASK